MLIVAILLLLACVVCGLIAFLGQRTRKALVTTETMTVGDLMQLRDAAVAAAGPGSFRYRCEVVGRARPARSGPLEAEFSDVECVWHKHVVTHKYWEDERRSDGGYRRTRKSSKFAEFSSERGFGIRDATGAIAIDPKGADVDKPEKVLERFEKAEATQGTTMKLGALSLSLGGGSDTIGYEYEEWAVRPDQELYVLGDVIDKGDRLVMVEPTNGPYLISTRSEEQVLKSETRKHTWGTIGAVVSGVTGVAALVLSFLT